MKELRTRLLKSKVYWFFIIGLIVFLITFLLSSILGKAKPIEKFSIFVSGSDFDNKVLRERVNSYKTEEYDYILVFDVITADVDEKDFQDYTYDYRFNYEAIDHCDIIIYPQAYFENTFTKEAYAGHFNKINELNANLTMENEYAIKLHDKSQNAKDEILGITFGDDNYLMSINKKTVHDSDTSNAAKYFLEAFIHE